MVPLRHKARGRIGVQFPFDLVFLLVVAALVAACTPNQDRLFLAVQLCLQDEKGLERFRQELQSIAKSEGMTFTDGSAETKAGLDNTGGHQDGPIINIGVRHTNGAGIHVANLGLPGYQAALFFDYGTDSDIGRAMGARVVKALQQHWTVITLPKGKGAFPLSGCGKD